MHRNIIVNLGNLVLSLSEAMDLASPLLIQHQQRTAYIVYQMASYSKEISDSTMEQLIMAALLHDIGAFSLEEKINLRNFEIKDIDSHCIRGQILLAPIPWFQEASKIVRLHHKEWHEYGDSIESPLIFCSQLLCLADNVERLIDRNTFILHQNDSIAKKIMADSGKLFHPIITQLFHDVSNNEEFWLNLVSQKLFSILVDKIPQKNIDLLIDDMTTIAELYRNIIDFRSRWTSTHSSGVAASSSMLGRILGLSEQDASLLEVAGNLHDIGKLSIPNSILDKPGKLTSTEMALMKSHTYHTYSIINSIGDLRQIAEWSAYHHEKLDGSGYPFRCSSVELNTGARILMVADIFTALAEDRPYRNGMTMNEIIKIMKELQSTNKLDNKIINLLLDNLDQIVPFVRQQQKIAKDFYEDQFNR